MWISAQFILAAVSLCYAKPPDSLRMVHYLFRHGDRTPIRTFKGDLDNPEVTWPKGFGQLTTVGMRQHFALGKYFRQRYDGFINQTYFNREIHVRSTDVDRTLMSAYSHLAGLYPPVNEDIWNKNISWQPIPVHTLPGVLDYVLRCDDCPRHAELEAKVFDDPYFKNISKKYEKLMAWISAKMGQKYTAFNMSATDTIFIERLKKLPVPPFINDTLMDTLDYLLMLDFKAHAFTPEIQRVTGGAGPLVNDVIERFKLKIQGTLDPDLKLYIYSAHDSTVSAFLSAIQCFNDIWPPYTATVIMELHQVNKEYFIEFSYKNDSTKEPYDLVLPGCSKRCPFDKFVELTKPIISDDVEKECKTTGFLSGRDSQRVQLIVFATIAGISVMIVLLQVGVIISLTRRNRHILYSRVDLNM